MNKKVIFVVIILIAFFWASVLYAAPLAIPKIGLEVESSENPEDVALSLQIIALLTVLSLAPNDLFYPHSCCTIVFAQRFSNPTDAAQPGFDWFSIIFDVFYYGAGLVGY